MLVIGSTIYCALRCSRAAGYPSPPLRIDGVKVRTSLLALIVTAAAAHGQRRERARDVGIPLEGTPGPLDAITDVAGVEVGHRTLMSGSGGLVVGEGAVRTGVTAVFPPRPGSAEPPVAPWVTLD